MEKGRLCLLFDEEQIRSSSKLPAVVPQSFSLGIIIALPLESDDNDDDYESGVFSPAAAIVGQLVQQSLHARYEGIAILGHTSPLPSDF
jgi:hypothetical protein